MAAFVAWERRSAHPMLDVRVFRNLRFSAASVSIAFVFFALMGVVYFLTTYLQTVLGYGTLDTGVRMLPIAGGMIVASTPVGGARRRRLGTKLAVGGGLAHRRRRARAVRDVRRRHRRTRPIAVALTTLGLGIGLAMSPATEAIMGALPRAKAGIGSAMNDVVREVGGTLGIAVLGSVLSQRLRHRPWTTTSPACPAAAAAAASGLRRRRARGRGAPRRHGGGAPARRRPTRRSSTAWPPPPPSRRSPRSSARGIALALLPARAPAVDAPRFRTPSSQRPPDLALRARDGPARRPARAPRARSRRPCGRRCAGASPPSSG